MRGFLILTQSIDFKIAAHRGGNRGAGHQFALFATAINAWRGGKTTRAVQWTICSAKRTGEQLQGRVGIPLLLQLSHRCPPSFIFMLIPVLSSASETPRIPIHSIHAHRWLLASAHLPFPHLSSFVCAPSFPYPLPFCPAMLPPSYLPSGPHANNRLPTVLIHE